MVLVAHISNRNEKKKLLFKFLPIRLKRHMELLIVIDLSITTVT